MLTKKKVDFEPQGTTLGFMSNMVGSMELQWGFEIPASGEIVMVTSALIFLEMNYIFMNVKRDHINEWLDIC